MHDPTLDRSGEPVPEADAIEQGEVVDADDGREEPDDAVAAGMDRVPDDAPEADAIEQATPVPGTDEDAPR